MDGTEISRQAKLVKHLTDYIITQAPILLSKLVVAALILLVAWGASLVLVRMVLKVLSGRNTKTIAPVIGGLVKFMILGAGSITALSEVGIDIKTVLAGAGVLGLAVGFGAQTFVKDLFSGFFLIFDGVIQVGDIVKIAEVDGEVISVGLRMTQIRSFNGRLWYIPNGNIATVANDSREWFAAVVNVGIGYGDDARKSLQVLQKVGDKYVEDYPQWVMEKPQAQGILSLDSSSVGLRLMIKVRVPFQAEAERELRLRVKEAFDREKIEIPFPHQVVMTKASTYSA
ncbi:MAG: mechanosensitive ion channel family protein [Bdellovibrionales bacterium]|nr:mechanosensitive ion channel family protein [Bdellovibrionales bacterium]